MGKDKRADLPLVSDESDPAEEDAGSRASLEAREAALAEKEAKLRAKIEAKRAKKAAKEAPPPVPKDSKKEVVVAPSETEKDNDASPGAISARDTEEVEGAGEDGEDGEGGEGGEEEGENPEVVLEYPNEYYNDDGDFVGNQDVLGWGTVLYDYVASGEGEISLKEGELIGILEHDNEGWTRGDFFGYIGSFPTSYVQLYDDSQQEEVQQRQRSVTERTLARRDERDQLKGEMREVRAQLEAREKEAEELEAAIKELAERKQKLHKDLRKQRSNMSDEQSVVLDFIKLAYDMDVESDAYSAAAAARGRTLESLAACSADLTKEVKSNPGLAVYAQNLVSKLGSARKASTTASAAHEQAQQRSSHFRNDLTVIVQALSS